MRRLARHVCSFASFVSLAILLTWPLPKHLSTHLTASPAGDAGVYVWNLWVFRHELVERGRMPLYTTRLFPLSGEADLSLHNYTLASDMLAAPVIPRLGLVRTFNILFLLQLAASGYAVFLLTRFLTKRPVESWLAGAVFMASPVLTARSIGHFSLVAAAPLALFLLAVLCYRRDGRVRNAVAAGAILGWAGYSDAYFAVYCVMLAAIAFADHFITWRSTTVPPGRRRRVAIHILDGVVLVQAAIAITLAIAHSESVRIAGVHIRTSTIYTPMLILTIAATLRVVLAAGRQFRLPPFTRTRSALKFMAVTALVAAVVLSPLLAAFAKRAHEGRFVSPTTEWRSSPPGVDALSFVMPNPTNKLIGEPFRTWLNEHRPDGVVEYNGSFSLVALGVAILAWRIRRGAIPWPWIAGFAFFTLLALGPFIHVAGVNTRVPGPWALFRYVPVIGLARSPSRFAIVASMGLSILFAFGLASLREHATRRRLVLTVGVAAALALELGSVPRRLFSARVPDIYRVIAADPDRSARVLELPTGVRDGTSAVGNFSAATQFYQGFHGKTVVGGYLSRISPARLARQRRMPVMNVLLTLSENAEPDATAMAAARRARNGFCQFARIRYVVVDTTRASEPLRRISVDLLDLEFISASDGLELYRPRRVAPAPRLPGALTSNPPALPALPASR